MTLGWVPLLCYISLKFAESMLALQHGCWPNSCCCLAQFTGFDLVNGTQLNVRWSWLLGLKQMSEDELAK
jgi:hypothetical protein